MESGEGRMIIKNRSFCKIIINKFNNYLTKGICMNEDYFIFLVFFFGTWAVCNLPQVKLYFPLGLPIGPGWAMGVAFLCFCGIRCTKEDFQNSAYYKKIALHEYCHQLQKRLLSPLGLGLINFIELFIRKIFINKTWKGAYENLYVEKQARQYMNTGKLVWKWEWFL